MEQPELGKNEEESEVTSSAELSETETAAAPETSAEPTANGNGVGDTPSEGETDSVQELAADVASDDDVPAVESAASDDDEADETTEDATANSAEGDDKADETTVDSAASDEAEATGPQRGEVIQGSIIRTTPNEIFVDLGEGYEGIVPKREVELMSGKILEEMKMGAEVYVYVVNPHNHRGEVILSINHAQEELDWRSAEEYLKSKEVYDGKIGGYNKGGLIVRFGRLRGFVPQSQISDKRQLDIQGETPEERYGGLVNNQISVKVMEVDRSRNRLILSERAAMREVRQRRKEALITELKVGEVREGRVVSLENFGAFVDVGGAEGLVHITELSWKHITHPRQVLNVGQAVEVRVINVDESKNRIGLSIKQLKADPWDELATRFGNGALIRGTVTKLTKFGAFARIRGMEAIEGLIHISELSDERVEHPRDVVNKGDKLTLRVVKVDVKNRRLGLSLRRVNSAEFLDEDLRRAYTEERIIEDEPEEIADEPESEVEAPVEAIVEETETVVDEAVAEVEAAVEETETVADEAVAEVEAAVEETDVSDD
ncbi:MAG: S1 RNA-binding domain-containing protein [Anaerolineae bacterium]|nr:S1 RNA-binding domain-containing protein [Anaerolineae bacterium]